MDRRTGWNGNEYAEALLAMKYRVKNAEGEYSSGPMYYIERGIGRKWRPLAVAFAFSGHLQHSESVIVYSQILLPM